MIVITKGEPEDDAMLDHALEVQTYASSIIVF
jgi:hypothetical protein